MISYFYPGTHNVWFNLTNNNSFIDRVPDKILDNNFKAVKVVSGQ